MTHDPINPDGRALENAFFARENAKLLERLRQKAAAEERRQALRAVMPNADDATLDRLSELGIKPETALAVMLVPLAAVAWADGSIDARERKAILMAAAERGVAEGTPAHTLLVSWLETRPGAELVEMWRRYVRTLSSALTPGEREQMRDRLLGLARGVAESAGGFLGIGKKVSPAEQLVLDDVASVIG